MSRAKKNTRTAVKFSRYVQPKDKTVVDTLLALAGKSCCSNNVDTGLIPRSDLEQRAAPGFTQCSHGSEVARAGLAASF